MPKLSTLYKKGYSYLCVVCNTPYIAKQPKCARCNQELIWEILKASDDPKDVYLKEMKAILEDKDVNEILKLKNFYDTITPPE